jgi:hypothetical protein
MTKSAAHVPPATSTVPTTATAAHAMLRDASRSRDSAASAADPTPSSATSSRAEEAVASGEVSRPSSPVTTIAATNEPSASTAAAPATWASGRTSDASSTIPPEIRGPLRADGSTVPGRPARRPRPPGGTVSSARTRDRVPGEVVLHTRGTGG